MADDEAVDVVLQNGVNHDSSEQPAEEKELTQTDHLNKRLLESFMNRLDDGSFQVPHSANSDSGPIPKESDDFDDN